GDPLVEMLDMARESLALGDVGGAAQAYAQVLQADPNNLKALGGLAKVFQQSGDLERAAEIVEMAGPEAHDPDLDSVRAALALVDDAMAGDRLIGMIQTRGGARSNPILSNVGCVGRITSYNETSDGRYLITLTGVCRFDAGEELSLRTPYRQVRAKYERFERDLSDEEAKTSE